MLALPPCLWPYHPESHKKHSLSFFKKDIRDAFRLFHTGDVAIGVSVGPPKGSAGAEATAG
jgi:hypothetical protein